MTQGNRAIIATAESELQTRVTDVVSQLAVVRRTLGEIVEGGRDDINETSRLAAGCGQIVDSVMQLTEGLPEVLYPLSELLADPNAVTLHRLLHGEISPQAVLAETTD